MPFFSVLIPTRNRAFLLRNAVNSVLSQTFGDFEVVIGDNGSDNGTFEFFSGLSDGRVRYHRAPRFLLGDESMQFVFSHAAGQYFIVMGDDDYLMPEALEEISKTIREKGSRLLAFGLVTYYDSTYYEPERRNTLHFRQFSGKVLEFDFNRVVSAYFDMAGTQYFPPHPSATVFERGLAEEISRRHGAFYLPIYADIISVPLAIARARRMDFIDKPLVIIGRGSESQVAKEVYDPEKMWEHIAARFDNVPFKGRISNNALAESILRLKKYEPDTFSGFDLHYPNYCAAYYQGLVDSALAGNDVSSELREFSLKAPILPCVSRAGLLKMRLRVRAAAVVKRTLTRLGLLGCAKNLIGGGSSFLDCALSGISDIAGCARKISATGGRLGNLREGGGRKDPGRSLAELVTLAVGRGLVALSTIIAIRVMTALLDPSEIGRLNIILSVGGGFMLVLISPVGLYMTRRLVAWQRALTAWISLKKFGGFLLSVSFLNAMLAAVYHGFIGIEISLFWLVALVSANILFTAGNSSFSSVINMLGHRGMFVLVSVLTVLAGLIFSAVFAVYFGRVAEYWLSGQLLAQAIILLLVLGYLRKCLAGAPSSQEDARSDFNFKSIFPFAWPLAVGVVFYWLQTQGYRFAVESKYGVGALGHFAVGFGIGTSIMLAFEAVFNQFYLPIFYREISGVSDREKTEAWNRYASAFIPLVVVTAAFVAANSRAIARILVPSGYGGIEYILAIGVLSESIRIVVTLLSMVSHAKYHMAPLILPGMLGAMVSLGAILMAPASFTVESVGLFLASGWTISLIALFFRMRTILDIKIPIKLISQAVLFSTPFLLSWYAGSAAVAHECPWLAWAALALSGIYLLLTYAGSSEVFRGVFAKVRKLKSLPLSDVLPEGRS